jgi:hypothetical protein
MATRISGVLVAWRISKSGGMGRVLADGKLYFTCRRFILEGVPIVGCPVTFEVQPAQAGGLFPQAVNARIDNRKIVREMDLPRVELGNGGVNVRHADLSAARAILSGRE